MKKATSRVKPFMGRDLKDSGIHYQRLFETAGHAILIMEAETGAIIDVNPQLINMLGYSHAEFLGTKFCEMSVFMQTQVCREIFAILQRDGSISHQELPLKTKSGQVIQVEFNGSVYLVGQEKFIQCSLQDITERKQMQGILRESEELYRDLYEQSPVGYQSLNADGRFLFVNQAWLEIFGYTRQDEVKGKWFGDFLTPKYVEEFRQRFEQFKALGSIHSEFEMVRKDGAHRNISFEGRIAHDPHGNFKRTHCIIKDFTERKKADDALENERNLLRTLIDNLPDTIYAKDTQGRFLFKNLEEMRLIGANSPEEVIGKTDFDYYPPELAARYQADDQAVIRSGQPLINREEPVISAAGNQHWLLTTKVPWRNRQGEIVGLVGIGHDITERKQAEEALRESEKRYRHLFEDSPISLWDEDFSAVKQRLDELRRQGVVDFQDYLENHPEIVAACAREARILDVNKATLALFKAENKADLLNNLSQIFTENSYKDFLHELVYIAGGKTEFKWEGANQTLTGEQLMVSLGWSVLPGYQESFSRVIVSMVDITERKQAEDALNKSEAELRALFAAMPDVVIVLNKNGRYLKIAPTNPNLLYKPEDQLVGKTLGEIFPKAEAEMFLGWIETALNTGQTVHQEFPLPIGERIVWFACSISPMSEDAVVYVARDITGRKQAEKELQRSAEQFELLYDVGLTLNSVRDPQKQLETILDLAQKALHAYRTDFFRYDPAQNKLYLELNNRYPEDATREILLGFNFSLGEEKGLVGLVGATRQPLYLSDVQSDPRWILINPEVHSALWAPVEYEQQLIGVLCISDTRKNAFSPDERRLLELFASQVAVAVENTRLYTTLDAEKRRLELLYILNQQLSQSLDPERVGMAALELLRSAFGVFKGNIFVPSADGEKLKLLVAVGMSPAEIAAFNQSGGLHTGMGITSWTTVHREPIIAADVEKNEHWVRLPGLDDGVRSVISVPLLAGDDLVGVLNLLSDHVSTFRTEHIDILQAAAAPVAVALQSADLFAKTHQQLVELETISKVSTALRAAQTLDEMLPLLLDTTLEVVHASRGAIWLYDSAQVELRMKITRGLDGDFPNPLEKPSGGIVGFVLTSGRPYTSRELHLDLHLSKSTRQLIPPGVGGTFIPISAGNAVMGIFVIIVPLPRELTASEIRLLTTVSEIAGNAIQRTALHEQTERRLQHLSALSVIDRAITSSFDLRFSLTTLLNQTIAQLGVDAADVLLFNPGLQRLEFSAGTGFRTQAFERTQLRLGEGYAGRAALESRLIHIADLAGQRDNPRLFKHLAAEQFVSYYGVPLIAKGQVKGVLEIFQRAPLTPDTEWLDFLKALAEQAAIAVDNASLFESLQRSNVELMMAYDATIEGWSRALDLRDRETQGHTQRVTDMTVKLARVFGLSDEELIHIRRGALLHDIGKMGVPDGILLKPGPLTDEEWTVMKKHPIFAYEMLSPIRYLRAALDIPYCHHERWDGTGYPRGLKGEQIPFTARIFSVVDVWDALNSDRPYRVAWPEEKVREYIRAQAGMRFDPQIVNMCLDSGMLTRSQQA